MCGITIPVLFYHSCNIALVWWTVNCNCIWYHSFHCICCHITIQMHIAYVFDFVFVFIYRRWYCILPHIVDHITTLIFSLTWNMKYDINNDKKMYKNSSKFVLFIKLYTNHGEKTASKCLPVLLSRYMASSDSVFTYECLCHCPLWNVIMSHFKYFTVAHISTLDAHMPNLFTLVLFVYWYPFACSFLSCISTLSLPRKKFIYHISSLIFLCDSLWFQSSKRTLL